jgi:hypothetical protein
MARGSGSMKVLPAALLILIPLFLIIRHTIAALGWFHGPSAVLMTLCITL